MRLILSLLFTVAIACSVDAQKLAFRQGEVLVEVDKKDTPARAIELLKSNLGTSGDFKMKQVIATPMNVWKITFDYKTVSEYQVLRSLSSLSSVYNAQFNHIIESRKTPNDTEFTEQWQYINLGEDGGIENADIDIDSAWDLSTGGVTVLGDTIVVCIIDDGLDADHEDFEDNIWVNYNEIPDNGIDDDENGYLDDHLGWDTYFESDKIYKEGFHGTPVAGIVGAKGNNELGVAGVNWDVKLMIVRGGGDEAAALSAYAYPYALRKQYNETGGNLGAFVVSTNASWGIDFGQASDAPLWCNFYDALGEIGIISCGATANRDVNVDTDGDLPTACSSDYLISVSNIKRDGSKEESAGFGLESIDLGAYGSETYTVSHGNTYGAFGGTSAATPHVTGAVALVYALPYPELIELAKNNPAEAAILIKDFILDGTKKEKQFEDLFLTSGVLNIKNSFDLTRNFYSECSFPLEINIANLNLESASISWDSPEEAESFDLRYKLESADEWTDSIDVTSPLIISGLDTCASYEVQIKSFCDMDSSSEFSLSQIFTSLGCCDAPEGLLVSNEIEVTPANTLFLTWDEDPDHLRYTIEYKFNDSDEWLSVETEMNSFTLSELSFCTAYDIRIKALCITGVETDYSAITTAASGCGNCTNLDYCEVPSASNFGEWIESITIDEQEIVTGADFGYVNNSGFYDIDLNIGSDIVFKLDKGFSSISFEEWVKVWVDLDQDGVLTEDEVVFNEGEATTNDIDTFFNLAGIEGRGYTLMRVAMVYLDEPIACEDPLNFEIFGEYEDYCVRLVGPCDYGLSITSVSPQETSATVTYTMVDTSIAYNVRFKEVEQGDDEWETISVLDTTATISPLEECTSYVVQIRAVCETDTSGFEAVQDTFVTNGSDCMVSTFDIEDSSISMNAMPNPFVNELSLKLESEFSGKAKLQVLNIQGQVIHVQNHFILQGSSRIDIGQSSNWDAGIYFLQLISDDFKESVKVIKLGK